MKVDIRSKRENPLQERTEVLFGVDHNGEPTPSRDALRSKLAEQLNVSKERVVIDQLKTRYGKGSSAGYAKVYATLDAVKARESEHIQIRHGLKEKSQKAKKEAKAKPAASKK